jgi:thiol-disulfide isomerase/thioredoxin
MKEILIKLAIFVLLCLIFSGLAGCRGTQRTSVDNTPGNNAANTGNSSGPATGENQSSKYPPLASGLAETEFELLDGTKTKVSEHKGKVIMLNIWGIWCGPCRQEMPHLVEMQDKYRDKGLEIIGLNIGDDKGSPESVDAIKAFVQKMGLNYTIARSPNSATAQFYQITREQVVPQTMLIDRDGHLRGVFVGGGAKIISQLNEVLDKTIAE